MHLSSADSNSHSQFKKTLLRVFEAKCTTKAKFQQIVAFSFRLILVLFSAAFYCRHFLEIWQSLDFSSKISSNNSVLKCMSILFYFYFIAHNIFNTNNKVLFTFYFQFFKDSQNLNNGSWTQSSSRRWKEALCWRTSTGKHYDSEKIS